MQQKSDNVVAIRPTTETPLPAPKPKKVERTRLHFSTESRLQVLEDIRMAQKFFRQLEQAVVAWEDEEKVLRCVRNRLRNLDIMLNPKTEAETSRRNNTLRKTGVAQSNMTTLCSG